MNIISRAEAARKGRKTYFTGIPCKHGHISERYTSNNVCITCSNIYNSRRVAKTRYGAEGWQSRDAKDTARRAAFEEGAKIFGKGIPCLHGHTSGYRVSNGQCVECARQRVREAGRRSRAAIKALRTSQTYNPGIIRRLAKILVGFCQRLNSPKG